MVDPKKLDEFGEKAINDYLDKRSMLMIEAAIGILLDTRTPAQAAEVLREFAADLEEFG